jgi:23S rRNA (uracil1939-C5)-methyltransferase
MATRNFSLSQQNQNRRRRRGSKRPNHSKPDQPSVRCEVTIDELGHQGDGIATLGGEKIFVPFSAPGDHLSVDRQGARATIVEILSPSTERRDPPCVYFGKCGGCALQHVTPAFENNFKRQKLQAILQRHGIEDVPLLPTIHVGDATRRRATFTVARSKNKVILGFQARQSHEHIDIASCTILVPQIVESLPKLRQLMMALLKNGDVGQLQVTAYENGLDLDVQGLEIDPFELGFERLDLLTDAAANKIFARLSFDGQSYLEPESPRLQLGAAKVTPPPSSFLQASADSQTALQNLVFSEIESRVKKNRRVADFFSGCGTFSFVLASQFVVEAFDHGQAMVLALKQAAENTPGLQNLTVENRDLYRRPLQVKDLKRFDAVVLDPPRAGAIDQVAQIAASSVSTVVYASCDPATFARDCETLIKGGYKLISVTPVDQFKYSAHLECVAILEK